MSLQKKITFGFFVLLIGLPIAGLWFIRHNRVARVPPKPREEIAITIIPGWTLRDVANNLVKLGIASSTLDVYKVTGKPADQNEPGTSAEGSLAPETVRFFKDVTVEEVIKTFHDLRVKQLTPELIAAIKVRNIKPEELLTMASIVEKEARTEADRKLVADILWRRVKVGMALQVDSTVHYAIDKTGDVYTTDKERSVDSSWNTYKHPGLPPGPICNPSLDSIEAALSPEPNGYWFFLSGTDGVMHYAKTLEEHTANRYKYLR